MDDLESALIDGSHHLIAMEKIKALKVETRCEYYYINNFGIELGLCCSKQW